MDMFKRRTTFGGGFNATSAKVLFAGFQSGLAFETMSVQYAQQVVRLWDLDGSGGNTYLVAGHAQGNASVSKAIGPRALATAFYQRYGDVCRASENQLFFHAETGCVSDSGGGGVTNAGAINLSMSGVVIEGVNLQVSANDPIMRQSFAMQFIALDWDERGGPAR